MKKKWWLFIVLIAVVALSTFLYLQNKPKGYQDQNSPSSSLLSFPVVREDISNTIEVKGKSSYAEETWIYAPFQATVDQWHVEEGQSVTTDTILFELDSVKLRNEINLAEAQLVKQQLMSKLNAINSTSEVESSMNDAEQQAFNRFAKQEETRIQQQLDDITNKITEMDLNDKKDRLTQAEYKSPKSGIFLFTDQQKPKSVSQDTIIGKIVELTSLQLLSTVTEYDVFQIKEGMEVDIRIDALKQLKVKGIVEQVSKFAKTNTSGGASVAQFEVRISLDQSNDLIAGLSLTGKIITDSKEDAIVVPTLAIMREDEQYFVYVATPSGEVEKKVIKIGIETSEKTEVIEGLSEGDTVVLQ